MKKTKRKAFNFLRSYFDVLNELKTDADKLNFLLSIINKQFLNEEPKELNFIVNLCYESQRHQIESSVKGWERASKEALGATSPTTLWATPPTTHKEEKEKGEEEDKKKVYNYTLEREILNSVANLFDNKYYNTGPKKQKWLDEIRKLIQIDGENKKTIIDVIKFARTNEFWAGNLLSINSLRNKNKSGITKFDQIKAKIPNLSTTPNKKIGNYIELTEKEKEAQHVNVNYTYIHFEKTYKKVHSDDKGNYIEKGRERIYL